MPPRGRAPGILDLVSAEKQRLRMGRRLGLRDIDRIELELTTACNLGCNNCDRSCATAPSSEQMTTAQVQAFVDETITTGKRWQEIRLLGGEPTLHPELEALCARLLRHRDTRAPSTRIVLVTNGHGARVAAALARLPHGIEVESSAKLDAAPLFRSFNEAPADLPEFMAQGIDFSEGCVVPGLFGFGLSTHGYYACGPAASIDRVFGLDLGVGQLDAVTDAAMRAQCRALCRYCGHFKVWSRFDTGRDYPRTSEQRSSASWQQAYARYLVATPLLALYPRPVAPPAVGADIAPAGRSAGERVRRPARARWTASPRVSVVVTTYNYGRFVEQAVRSVADQEAASAAEILVVDDGSTDDTSARLAPLVRDGTLRYFGKPNGGQASAVNLGYRAARGEIVAFLDADDYWHAGWLQRMLHYYEDPRCQAVFGNLEFFWDGDPARARVPYRSAPSLRGLPRIGDSGFLVDAETCSEFFSPTSGQSLRRTLGDRLFPVPPAFTRHVDTYLQYLTPVVTPFVFESQPLIAYRQHGASHLAALARQELRFLELELTLNLEINRAILALDERGACRLLLQRREEYCHRLQRELDQRRVSLRAELLRLGGEALRRLRFGEAWRSWLADEAARLWQRAATATPTGGRLDAWLGPGRGALSAQQQQLLRSGARIRRGQRRHLVDDHLVKRPYKVVRCRAEFGAELKWYLGFAYWHHLNGTLLRTESLPGTASLYYFSPDHQEHEGRRRFVGPDPQVPNTEDHNFSYDLRKWAPPPLREIYQDRLPARFDRPLVIISNKYNREWDRGPINFLDLPLLAALVRKLGDRFQVIYNRPTSEQIVPDHNTVLDLGDTSFLARECPQVLLASALFREHAARFRDFNHFQLALYARCERFISTQGGNAVLASYFGGVNLVLCRDGHELLFDEFRRFYPRLSGARVLPCRTAPEILAQVQATF